MKLYGWIGEAAEGKLRKAIFDAAILSTGLQAEFRLFRLEKGDPQWLENFCHETELNGVAGFCVEEELQIRIMEMMDHYDPLAKAAGAADTVANEDLNLLGYNAQATGAMGALEEVLSFAGESALVIGAGPKARAFAYTLRESGASVQVFDPDSEKAELLAKALGIESIDYLRIGQVPFRIILNAGPASEGKGSLLHASQISQEAVVMESVFPPLETALLKEAKKAGAKTIAGDRLLLHQMASQFEIWFGQPAPLEAMEKALSKGMGGKK